jgi:hypothetical protein
VARRDERGGGRENYWELTMVDVESRARTLIRGEPNEKAARDKGRVDRGGRPLWTERRWKALSKS